MSLLVVMKGPVARAGSMPYLLSVMGTKVPISEAITMTVINETETVIPKIKSDPSKK